MTTAPRRGRRAMVALAAAAAVVLAVSAMAALPPLRAPVPTSTCGAVKVPVASRASLSDAMRRVVAKSPSAHWCTHPGDAAAWRTFATEAAAANLASLPRLRASLRVTETQTRVAGVPVFVFRPMTMAPENSRRSLIYLHGGGFALSGGGAGNREAILTAGLLRVEVVSVDYRTALDAPFPAALEDAFAVWREIAKARDPRSIGFLGTSAGGNLALAVVLKARRAGVPLPAAVAVSTPWVDLADTGDTIRTNENLDNVVVSASGWLSDASALYARDHDIRDPLLSPLYGDFRGFPPTLLTSGTRDLFLSDTVRLHRKLREAGVDARLNVFEALSHAQHLADPDSAETKDYFSEVAGFFDDRLAR